MRIAFVTETWLPSTDGIVTRLVATVRELHARGHDVLVIAPEAGGPSTLAGARVRTVRAAGAKFLYGGKRWGLPLPRVGRYLREFDPDVVHLVNPAFLGTAGLLAARKQNRRTVASYHTDIARYARHYRLGAAVPLIWTLLRALHRRAHLNLATSSASVDDLARHGIGQVRLWPRGVDLERFRPAPSRRTDGRPVALYVGRLAPEKACTGSAPWPRRPAASASCWSATARTAPTSNAPCRRARSSPACSTATPSPRPTARQICCLPVHNGHSRPRAAGSARQRPARPCRRKPRGALDARRHHGRRVLPPSAGPPTCPPTPAPC
ncbi:glycosyltransferase [Amycolatopsis carbonis]|uniref:Glycosyltransferase n=1 Tax=Amycolatopsis carbonis TaxID=715471 RepID=A0A9Y2N1E7_9PSEU|nr:glycosyltransferase [Amycolatopsis sp. 2-15]WIX82902.1 glycosyltransferase [Amycolatopsis sp. 2-15]